MGITGDDQPFDRGIGPGGLHRRSHHGGGFPGAEHDHPPARAFRQMPRQHLARIGAGNGRVEDLAECGAGGCIGKGHGEYPFGNQYGEVAPNGPSMATKASGGPHARD